MVTDSQDSGNSGSEKDALIRSESGPSDISNSFCKYSTAEPNSTLVGCRTRLACDLKGMAADTNVTAEAAAAGARQV